MLLEFKKDSDRVLLAVAQRPDGKKNWMVFDQVLVETTKCGMLNRLLGVGTHCFFNQSNASDLVG